VVPSVGGDIDFRIGDRVMAVICRGIFVWCVGWRSRSMRAGRVTRQRRQSRQIGWDRDMRSVAVINASRLVSVNIRMVRISFMVGLRSDINQAIGRVLRPLLLGEGGDIDSRINGRGMFRAWL